jgi:hypothetical protein
MYWGHVRHAYKSRARTTKCIADQLRSVFDVEHQPLGITPGLLDCLQSLMGAILARLSNAGDRENTWEIES